VQDNFITQIECDELAKMMHAKYQYYLESREFFIAAKKDKNAIHVTITLQNPDGSYCYPVQARIDAANESLTDRRSALFLIDYIDLYFEEFLTDGGEDLFIPIDWSDYEWDTVNFQLKGQVLNNALETKASKLIDANT
jgi:hypothetical protein